MPIFDERQVSSQGSTYTAPTGTRTTKKKGKKTTGGANQGVQQMDIYHSYWGANAEGRRARLALRLPADRLRP